MKRSRWPVVLALFLLSVVVGIFAIWRTELITIPILQQSFVDDAPCEEIAAAVPPPCENTSAVHNFRRPNRVITEYDSDVKRRLATLVERQATATDPELIRLIRDLLDPPSREMVKMSRQLFSTPQSREVDGILKKKVMTCVVCYSMVCFVCW